MATQRKYISAYILVVGSARKALYTGYLKFFSSDFKFLGEPCIRAMSELAVAFLLNLGFLWNAGVINWPSFLFFFCFQLEITLLLTAHACSLCACVEWIVGAHDQARVISKSERSVLLLNAFFKLKLHTNAFTLPQTHTKRPQVFSEQVGPQTSWEMNLWASLLSRIMLYALSYLKFLNLLKWNHSY